MNGCYNYLKSQFYRAKATASQQLHVCDITCQNQAFVPEISF